VKVICVNAGWIGEFRPDDIVAGKSYDLVMEAGDMVRVITDRGEMLMYRASRFMRDDGDVLAVEEKE
jgi:hypothetical protein